MQQRDIAALFTQMADLLEFRCHDWSNSGTSKSPAA